VDFQKLADKLGYKNVRSAADSYYRFRRGLDLGASSSSSSSSNPSARSSIRKKPRLRKRKVIYSDDDGEEGEEEGGEDEDSGSGGDAAGCEIKQECTEGDGVRIKLEGDNEEAIFVKSESEGEDDDGRSVIGKNNRRRSREEGGWFGGFQGTGYRRASTGTGSGFEGARFDGYGVLSGLPPPPLVVVERGALPEKVIEKEGVVVIKDEPVDEEKWVWKW